MKLRHIGEEFRRYAQTARTACAATVTLVKRIQLMIWLLAVTQ
jgi:hypothetical protein